jgi:glycosyltransferase involved in cell wall biosynthesis
MGRNRIVIVIPIFNDYTSLCQLIEQLSDIFYDKLSQVVLVIVDDGSVPPLIASIDAGFKSHLRVRVLTLKRNLGHERAIAIGIARGAR